MEVNIREAGGQWLRKTVVGSDIPTKKYVTATFTECWIAICEKDEKGFDQVLRAFNVTDVDAVKSITDEEKPKVKYVFYLSIPEFGTELRTTAMKFSFHEKAQLSKILKAIGLESKDFKNTDQIIGQQVEILVSCKVGSKGTKYYSVKDYAEKEVEEWKE